jgi:hypothetical protein
MANRTHLILLSALLLTACEPTRNKVVGEWSAMQDEQEITLVFRPDSTFVMDMGTFRGEGTFSVGADQAVVLRPTGVLEAVVPAGFTGNIRDWTLTLCNPAGNCTDLTRQN